MTKRKLGRPRRDPNKALDCYLRSLKEETEAQIGKRYGWKIQRGEWGEERCMTAYRYIKDGKNIYERRRELRRGAFGI
ncbi:hypothetical protein ES705_32655 [subsurface metagenome]